MFFAFPTAGAIVFGPDALETSLPRMARLDRRALVIGGKAPP